MSEALDDVFFLCACLFFCPRFSRAFDVLLSPAAGFSEVQNRFAFHSSDVCSGIIGSHLRSRTSAVLSSHRPPFYHSTGHPVRSFFVDVICPPAEKARLPEPHFLALTISGHRSIWRSAGASRYHPCAFCSALAFLSVATLACSTVVKAIRPRFRLSFDHPHGAGCFRSYARIPASSDAQTVRPLARALIPATLYPLSTSRRPPRSLKLLSSRERQTPSQSPTGPCPFFTQLHAPPEIAS